MFSRSPASGQPGGKPLDKYKSECRHGTAYTVISAEYANVKSQVTYYDKVVKIAAVAANVRAHHAEEPFSVVGAVRPFAAVFVYVLKYLVLLKGGSCNELSVLEVHGKLNNFKIDTPSAEFNNMINVWNAYQCFITFIWSRAASFIYCGLRWRPAGISCPPRWFMENSIAFLR